MKRHLLIGAALAAMLAGSDVALALDQRDMNQNAPGMPGNAPGTPNAPAEKIAPPGEKGPGPAPSDDKSRAEVNGSLTTAQRAQIRDIVVKQSNAPRVAQVDFSLSVGAPVPPRVQVAILPSAIAEIRPAWRDYLYFVVGDQIVIVEPGAMRIVDILPA